LAQAAFEGTINGDGASALLALLLAVQASPQPRATPTPPALDSAGRYVPDFRDGWVTWRLGGEERER
jgi:hypothetical protein